jgi:hypothetical protein
MSFSYRQFLRDLPAPISHTYFSSIPAFPVDSIDWALPQNKLAKSLSSAIEQLSMTESSPILGLFQRIKALACEKGMHAIFNASSDKQQIIDLFHQSTNDIDRAFRFYLANSAGFESAEEILYFDFRAEGMLSKHFHAPIHLTVNEALESLRLFEQSASHFFLKKEGTGRHCFAEITQRHTDDSVQLTLYTEALPSQVMEFGDQGLERRPSRPAKEFAIVYRPNQGRIETVVTGGVLVHQKMGELFCEFLLGIKPELHPLRPNKFELNQLVNGLDLEPDCTIQVSTQGIALKIGQFFKKSALIPKNQPLSRYKLAKNSNFIVNC